MSLILGIYSKIGEIKKNVSGSILESFSVNGTRKLETKYFKKLILSSTKGSSEENKTANNEDGSLSIVLSGNVYDFDRNVKNLIKKGYKFKDKTNGAEFLIHSYEEHGEDFLKDVNGNFALAIYSKKNDTLIIANDVFGLCPLFIYDSKDYLIFCNEYDPIVKYSRFDKTLDYDAIAEYFVFEIPLGDKTFFKSLYNLHPGVVFSIHGKESSLKKYANLNIKLVKDKDMGYFTEKVAQAVKNATLVRMKGKKKFFCALSGGADSRLFLSSMPQKYRSKAVFFSNYSPVLGEMWDRDVVIAKMIAKKAGLNHKITERAPKKDIDKSFFDRRISLRNYAYSLGGLYGGEFLGGECFKIVPIKINNIDRDVIHKKLRAIFPKKFLNKISDPYLTLQKELEDIPAENKEYFFCIKQLTRGFLTTVYFGSTNGWAETYSLSLKLMNSIYSDQKLLCVLLTVPRDYLIDYNLYNQLYKRHFREFINIPSNSILASRKDSCIPLMTKAAERKSYDTLKHFSSLSKYLDDKSTWKKGFFNPEYFKSKKDSDTAAIQLVDFESWYRKYV